MNRAVLSATLVATMTLGLGPVAAATARDNAPQPVRQCFSASRIANWAKVDDKTVNLRIEGGAYFQVILAGMCLKAARSSSSALSFATRVSDDVCEPNDLTVVVATGIAPLRCSVDSLRRLSPAEVAALPKKQKP